MAAYGREKRKLETLSVESPTELRGVNSRVDQWNSRASCAIERTPPLLGGVTLEDPASTFIDADVTVGADTAIGPGVLLEG